MNPTAATTRFAKYLTRHVDAPVPGANTAYTIRRAGTYNHGVTEKVEWTLVDNATGRRSAHATRKAAVSFVPAGATVAFA